MPTPRKEGSQARPKSPSRRRRSRSRSRSSSQTRQAKRSPTRTAKAEIVAPIATPTRISSRLAAKSDMNILVEKKTEIKAQFKEMEETNEKHLATVDEIKVVDEKKIRKTTDREFGGAIGAFFLIILLPATVFLVNSMCNKKSCTVVHLPVIPKNWSNYFDLQASLIFIGWFLFQIILSMLPLGKIVEGQPLVTGQHLSYRCNGFSSLFLSIIAFGVALHLKVPVTIVYDKFLQLMTSAFIFSFILSIILYLRSKRAHLLSLAPGGNTGNVIYDFFMGRELNPRIGSFDLKFFCELRPGLIGWFMINLCFNMKAYESGSPSISLIMVTLFQGLYIADALWFENAILTTIDIIHDGFGFMLVFGDLVWVPFLYTLQSRYLTEHSVNIPYYFLAIIFVINVIGYIMFRGSNSQKNDFRQDPHSPALAHLESIPTVTGKRLLVSGWWGICRKPNYLGDILMALAWSLTCGFGSILPYFYPVYFTVLLVHRERRDATQCQKKYGASWDTYCNRVEYRIIPYVY